MALINLKTSLKSLKYGRDTVNGGNSGQPYIVKPIPDSWSQIGNTGGYDSLVRGSSLILGKTADDSSRILQFLTRPNTQQGFFFLTKLRALSQQNVKTQVNSQTLNQGNTNIYNILANVAGSATQLHFPLFDTDSYFEFAKSNRGKNTENRLLALTKTKVNPDVDARFIDAIQQKRPGLLTTNIDAQAAFKNAQYELGATPQILYSYQNGGLNQTTLMLSNATTRDFNPFIASSNYLEQLTNNGSLIKTQVARYEQQIKVPFTQATNLLNAPIPVTPFIAAPGTRSSGLWVQSQLSGSAPVIGASGSTTTITDFRALNKSKYGYKEGAYVRPNIFGDPGRRGKPTDPNTVEAKNAYQATAGTDLVNFKYIYSNADQSTDPIYDYVDFHIAVFPNAKETELYRRTHIHFTAFLNGINDSFNAEWEAFRVMGRGENFYTYQGFNRDFTFNFSVHAQSKPELLRQKYKLDYLSSLIYPDYSAAGIMQGTFIELTIGDWMYQVPGIIQGFTYNIPDESPWQIQSRDAGAARRAHEWDKLTAANYEDESVLPHLIQVQGFKFTPIQAYTPKRWSREELWSEQLDPTNPNWSRTTIDKNISKTTSQGAANGINTKPYTLNNGGF